MQKLKNLERKNKLIVYTIIFISVVATLGNIVGVFEGEKTVFVTLIALILCMAVVVHIVNLLKKDPATTKIKYHAITGYFLFYLFTIFSTNRNIVYIYIIPVMYLYMLYNDVKVMKYIAIVAISSNVVMVCWFLYGLKMNDSYNLMNYIVQIISILTISVNSVIGTRMMNDFNQKDMEILVEANEKQEGIVTEVLNTGSMLEKRSIEMNDIVSKLHESTENMDTLVVDISGAMEKTSQNIENQTSLTKEIQNIIKETFDESQSMDELSGKSISNMEDGVLLVKDLSDGSVAIKESGINLNSAMVALMGKTKQIDQITETITSIAKQINILSLNASIESARAGEAGKGFAVVATEIGNLASQTAKSIQEISEVIVELQNETEHVFTTLHEFGAKNKQQIQLIQQTDEIFTVTRSNMGQVNNIVSTVTRKIEEIMAANDEIITSIYNIASESQQSLENIDGITNVMKETVNRVEDTRVITDDLMKTADGLKKYL